MTKIEPIIVPTKGEGNLFVISALSFVMNPENVTFFWQVLDKNEFPIIEGNIAMDCQTYSQWNNDDNFVINWACKMLNFVIV